MPGDTEVKGWVVVGPADDVFAGSFSRSQEQAIKHAGVWANLSRVVPATLRVHLGDRKEGV